MTRRTCNSNSGSSPKYPPAFIASDTTRATLSQRGCVAFAIASSIDPRPVGPRDSPKTRSLSPTSAGNSQSSAIVLVRPTILPFSGERERERRDRPVRPLQRRGVSLLFHFGQTEATRDDRSGTCTLPVAVV